ncbi:MAG TPA: hypothetical protein VKX28_25010 [Xanthobacteraceae bacterium]|nr:hypothetical protein [Xanthobacteraceae bacterium]
MLIPRLLHQCDQKSHIVDADIDANEQVAIIEGHSDAMVLAVNDAHWNRWDPVELPHIRHARWIAKDRVALYSFPPAKDPSFNAVRSFSPTTSEILPIGQPTGLLAGRGAIFVWYGEDQNLVASPDEIQSEILVAFSSNGQPICGLRSCLEKVSYSGIAIEVSAACIKTSGEIMFLMYSSDDLWRMDPRNCSITTKRISKDIPRFSAISEIGERVAFAKLTRQNLEIFLFDINSASLSHIESIDLNVLCQSRYYGQSASRIVEVRGNYDGKFIVVTNDSVWVIAVKP